MASDVDTCNLALSHLGQTANITSISPPGGSQHASICASMYPIAIGALLEMHDWRFAKRRATLALVEEDPTASWAYSYAIPNRCVKALRVLLPEETNDENAQPFKYETASDGAPVIYTNVEDAELVYTTNDITLAHAGHLFVAAAARLLASYIAGNVLKGKTGMDVAAAQLNLFAKFEFSQAKAADQQNGHIDLNDVYVPEGIKARA